MKPVLGTTRTTIETIPECFQTRPRSSFEVGPGALSGVTQEWPKSREWPKNRFRSGARTDFNFQMELGFLLIVIPRFLSESGKSPTTDVNDDVIHGP